MDTSEPYNEAAVEKPASSSSESDEESVESELSSQFTGSVRVAQDSYLHHEGIVEHQAHLESEVEEPQAEEVKEHVVHEAHVEQPPHAEPTVPTIEPEPVKVVEHAPVENPLTIKNPLAEVLPAPVPHHQAEVHEEKHKAPVVEDKPSHHIHEEPPKPAEVHHKPADHAPEPAKTVEQPKPVEHVTTAPVTLGAKPAHKPEETRKSDAEKETATQAESLPVNKMDDKPSVKQSSASRVPDSGRSTCARCSLF